VGRVTPLLHLSKSRSKADPVPVMELLAANGAEGGKKNRNTEAVAARQSWRGDLRRSSQQRTPAAGCGSRGRRFAQATEPQTMLRTITRSLYALVGAAFLLGGSAVLLLGTGLLPEPLKDAILAIGEDNTNTLHLMQEYASLLVLVALLSFWFLRHYEHSRAFHWVLTVFWGIIALIHWFDPRGHFHYGLGEAVTSIPFLLFLVVGLLRVKSEAVRATRA
jgi:hypothetical protein